MSRASSSEIINNLAFDYQTNGLMLGRLKLPYKSFNFLALISRGFGKNRYDRAQDIIELCQYFYSHISDVKNIINRIAEYAITDIQIDDTNTKLNKDQQETLLRALNHLNLKYKLIEMGKHYFVTGNVFVSVETKFRKHLKCPKCSQFTAPADRLDYTFVKKDAEFRYKCPRCDYEGNFIQLDIMKRSPENIYINLWDWHEIDFTYNPTSNEYKYYHRIPIHFTEKLTKGIPDKHLLETTKKEILKEVFIPRKTGTFTTRTGGKVVGFLPNRIKHIKNPSLNKNYMDGWGEPAIAAIIQDSFFMMLLRQAQAIFLSDYIVPIRVVSPDPKVTELIDIQKFATEFDRAYDLFQRDPIQIMKFPYPVQYQTLSGEGKQLMLSNEIDYTRQAIRRGLGLPSELLDGGMQNYSGGAISLRMLENYFINFLNNVLIELINGFIIPNICVILGIPPFVVNFAKFKMIDDIQQKQSYLELWNQNLIPDTAVWERYGVDKPSEKELKESIERKASRDGYYSSTLANFQSEVQSIMTQKQMQDQFDMQEMQLKNQKLQELKASTQVAENTGPKDINKLEGNPQPLLTPTGDMLPPAEELGDYAIGQLQTPEELNNFISELEKNLPNNKGYLDQVKTYITQSMPQQPQQSDGGIGQMQQKSQQMFDEGMQQSESNQGTKKMKILPEQKPQRGNNQI